MTKTALVILTRGFEEIEALTTVDLLRRAKINVTLATPDDSLLILGRSNITVQAEVSLSAALQNEYDALILPGGPGVKTLRKNQQILEALHIQNKHNALIAAICAAPLVLHDAHLLDDRHYTAHHSTQSELSKIIEDQAVVQDGNIITSRGAGTTIPFALAIITHLLDQSTSEKITKDIHYGL